MNRLLLNKLAIVIFTMSLGFISSAQSAEPADQKVYKTEHSDGSVTYSDQASNGAQEVVLNTPTSTFESKMVLAKPQIQGIQKQTISYSVTILSPQADETIRSNTGELSIGASIDPQAAGFFQLHINDQVHESATGLFKLDEMERGAYTFSVKFISNTGKIIASSKPRNVFLHQASALIN